MRRICEADDMPAKATVFKWLREKKEFSDQYEKAKAECADYLAEEILEIADDGRNDFMETVITEGSEDCPEIIGRKLQPENIQRSRLRVDARKWIASKLKPKKYGDKTVVTGEDGGPVEIRAHRFSFEGPESKPAEEA